MEQPSVSDLAPLLIPSEVTFYILPLQRLICQTRLF